MPLRLGQRKILTKRKRSRSAPPVLQSPSKKVKVKRKRWTNEQMEEALKAVASGMGINKAATEHNVPRTTLKDRISGRVQHKSNSGLPRYLNEDEEKDFAKFLKETASVGYGRSRKDVMNIAELYAKKKGVLRKSKITQGWWRQFVRRQEDLSLRRGDNTAHGRMDAVNEDTISHYFTLLKQTLKENNLTNSPGQIYNVDESGVPLDPKAPNVVTKKGAKKVRYRSTGKKGQITIVACGSATGQIIPPTVIFEAKNVNHSWTKNEIPGMCYGCSDSGWITTELFESWLCEHFLKHAVSERPLLLLLDGHSTHYQPRLIRYARDNQIILLCLPPHTTHEAQPLDCTVFSPLKAQWRAVCHEYFQANPGKVITKFNFVGLFTKAWSRSVTPANIIAGFKTCGIYPLDSSAIIVPQSKSDEIRLKGDHSTNTHLDNSVDDNGVENDVDDTFVDDANDSFTPEQEELFRKRYQEGYNLLIDPDYIRWIRIHHPESPLQTDLDNTSMISDFFPDIVPASPIALIENSKNLNSNSSPTPFDQSASDTEMVLSEQIQSSSTSSVKSGMVSSEHGQTSSTSKSISMTSKIVTHSENITIIYSTPTTSTISLSDYLVHPVPATNTVTTPTAPKRSFPRARLLTSDESLAMLEEKENAKKEALLEKEKRKIERAENKRKREESLQKKKEERARKAEEKARKQQEKAKAPSTRGRKKNKVTDATTHITSTAAVTLSESVSPMTHVTTDGTAIASASVTVTNVTSTSTAPCTSVRGHETSIGEVIDPNKCCMCFVSYEDDILEGTGADWIFCKCGRWLHEDCVEDIVKDSDGDERFCSFCLDKYTI